MIYVPPPAGVAVPAAHASTHISGGTDPFVNSQLLEAIVKRLQESGGPTTLTLGAVADGEALRRSGSTVVGAAVGGAVFGGSVVLDHQNQASGTSLTFSVPGGTLGADEDALLVIGGGTTDPGSAETLRLSYGGSQVFGHQVDAGRQFFFVFLLVRTGSSSQIGHGGYMASATAFSGADDRQTAAVDTSAAQNLVLDFSTAGNANRTIRLLHVVKLRAP